MEASFLLNEDNIILRKEYKKKNYKEVVIDEKKNLCYIFFSGNGIYFPNTQEEFTKTIIKNNRYEWEGIANSPLLMEKAGKYIFVRDIYKCWYGRGISEKINSIDKLCEQLREMTEGFRVIAVGNSAGGYMATLMGSLLKADIVYNFSGQFLLEDTTQKYGNICDFVNNNVMYFFPACCPYDIQQYELVKDKNICAFGFKTDIHGMSMYKANMPFILAQEKEYLVKLYNHYKDKCIIREEFFIRTCGWKMFIGRVFGGVIKKLRKMIKVG